jgi:hypothetical protein
VALCVSILLEVERPSGGEIKKAMCHNMSDVSSIPNFVLRAAVGLAQGKVSADRIADWTNRPPATEEGQSGEAKTTFPSFRGQN